jgi:calcium-dependent protein kinase
LISKQEKENLSKVFRAFDKNGDGKLSIDEVKVGYVEHYGLVMSDEDIEKMFMRMDADNSGFVDFSEFVSAAISEKEVTS